MSDKMRPIPFDKLMDWVLTEYARDKSIFSIGKIYKNDGKKTLPLFGQNLENPLGPAAGPHTQLAQNLIASYVAGGRFFELKTVQIIDGEDLPVEKPCILAKEEGYNVEWSTELTVPHALDEYIKGYFAIKLLAAELKLGDPNGFIFNMSVGYDLKGIKSQKIDSFIEGLKDAGDTPCFKECRNWALKNIHKFGNIDASYVEAISPVVSRSITLSTLHGCPAGEIEEIASYLLKEKGLHTYIKCNPTLLGHDYVRNILDEMGYGDIEFAKSHFENDLQFDEALPMLGRLITVAKERDLAFGVKLTNTFPVKAKGVLAGDEMYMSGKSLYPLSIGVARRLEEAFCGALPVSYSGGADINNVGEIFACHIWPITVATILLKPNGYSKMTPMAQKLDEMPFTPFKGVDVGALAALSQSVAKDGRYTKEKAPAPRQKAEKEADGFGCKVVCGTCAAVCPNRANGVAQTEDGQKVLVHFDAMCNECGNCTAFCPYGYVPYKEKLTLFATKGDMADSTNPGFLADVKNGSATLRINGQMQEISLKDSGKMEKIIGKIVEKYPFSL